MLMRGPTLVVHGNADHAPGNTMDGGTIVVHGSAGDAVAHSMRGGKVFVRDDIGYRGGIHMKEYEEKRPCLVVGGNARTYLGEYHGRRGRARPPQWARGGLSSTKDRQA